MAIPKQQKEFYKTFTHHGSGNSLIEIAPQELILLIHLAYHDLHQKTPRWFSPEYKKLVTRKIAVRDMLYAKWQTIRSS